MSAATVRGKLYRARQLSQEHGIPWWLTEDAIHAARHAGVEPPEGYELNEDDVGPVVVVATSPWDRSHYRTALLVRGAFRTRGTYL